MTEKDKLILKKVGIALLVVLCFAYIIYQLYMISYTPVKTEIAYNVTVEDTVDTDIFVAREESYITNDKVGKIISVASDGSRVAKDEEVAVVFSDASAADAYIKLNALDESIKRYTKLSNQSDNYTFDINDLNKNIDNSIMGLANVISNKDFARLPDSVNDVRDQVVTRQIATGSEFNFKKSLNQLSAEREKLASKNMDHASILAPKPGYYISGVDGLEHVADCKKVDEYTVEDIEKVLKAKPAPVPSNAIGKTVTEFTWYILCTVDPNSIGTLEVGEKIRVNLPYSSVNHLDATVYAINENTGKSAALVLSCNLMNSEISSLRKEHAELVTSEFSGLKISASAIRTNEKGQKGVYVRNGNLVKFKRVDIIYSADDYILSAADITKPGYVKLYDDVIIEGKDLYDGKTIK